MDSNIGMSLPEGERECMRGLLAAVIVMSVLIVVGVAVLAVTIVRRLSNPATPAEVTLSEPTGTHMQAIASAGDRLAVLLIGGGADRIVLLDPRTGKATGHIALVP